MFDRIILPVILLLASVPLPVRGALHPDTIKMIVLEGITVMSESVKKTTNRLTPLSVEVVGEEFLTGHFTGILTQALEYLPGVQSMDIGSGFSKPMIRGMSFNRISVVENGIKQEGQQWGSDHGLEVDAFHVESVTIRKGPASLSYGSDAMSGVIEIRPLPVAGENRIFGQGVLMAKSVNGTMGGSLMLGMKKDAWHVRLRCSGKQFGDYRVPTDTIVYLTQRIPVDGGWLKNTAGGERDLNFYSEYHGRRYYANYALSDVWQETGFFPGAHGIPDRSAVRDDGSSRNVELPFSRVNHFKASSRQQYTYDGLSVSWDVGFQNNHREEWSKFHTHYGTQRPPEKDPDRELAFSLNTFNSSVKLRSVTSGDFEWITGWDLQYQQNRIGGYSFLLPAYERFTSGLSVLGHWRPSLRYTLSGGLRYDGGAIAVSAFRDPHLEAYLRDMGYGQEAIGDLPWRSYAVERRSGDFSGSLGIVWHPAEAHLLKFNLGRSFRLPSAQELAANGVHHGSFRHEQGDPTLASERGGQFDLSYLYEQAGIALSAGAFYGRYDRYIYLKPTGVWSLLPHAGQVYRYTGAKAVLAGAECSLDVKVFPYLSYTLAGEYVYTANREEHTPLSFSPPGSLRNILTLRFKTAQVYAELHSIGSQNRVAGNESTTQGAHLVHLGGNLRLRVLKTVPEVSLTLRNLFDTKYYNHLSFYRKVEIPEPGRNFQLLIKVPIKSKIK
jgi:iron complex outermembrane receptor protein